MTKEEYDYLVSVKDTGTEIERIQAAVALSLFPNWEDSPKIEFGKGIEIIGTTITNKVLELKNE